MWRGLKIIAPIALTAILLSLEFNLLESALYDFRLVHAPSPKRASPEIVLVELDDRTIKHFEDFAPLSLEVHADFLEKLGTLQPKAVGSLINMNQVRQVNPELFSGKTANRFLKAVKKLNQANIPFIFGTPFDINGEVLPPHPLATLDHGIALIHKDGNVFSEDKVTRRTLSYLYNKPTFHIELAEKLNLVKSNFKPRGSFYVPPPLDAEYFFFRFRGDPSSIHQSPFKHVSFLDVLQNRVNPKDIQGKIVLLGTLLQENPSDFARTPFSTHANSTSKLTIHANILESVLYNDSVPVAPTWVNAVVTLALISFVFWAVFTKSPLAGVGLALGATSLFFLVSFLLFQFVWVIQSQPLVGVFLSYYLAVPYRLIQEYKQRWDYQRKNELLTQVEELKSNFLGLVTHDLKTPVARIQGLTEGMLRNLTTDPSTLNKILRSTDELNRFISSILELTKIESQHIHLTLEDKDINQVIEKSIESLESTARDREIVIETKLDPLFPIKMDVSLISRVLNNLIDNAIKYSPSHSVVRIESSEQDDYVQIRITDQGGGFEEGELEQVFTKFFRGKTAKQSESKGTGLGLFLTKYFVESHEGTIEVLSQANIGSTFIIRLPIRSKLSKNFKPGLIQTQTPFLKERDHA